MRRFWLWFFCLLLLSLACGRTAPPSPVTSTAAPTATPQPATPTPIAAATRTPFPATITPAPRPTLAPANATPTKNAAANQPTPAPDTPAPAAPDTPLLFYFKSADGSPIVIAQERLMVWMNLAGEVVESGSLAHNPQWQVANSLSPDGQWLAYYSGTAGAGCMELYDGGLMDPPYDLSLALFDLPNGNNITPVGSILPPDYPNNITDDAQASRDVRLNTFLCGLTSHRWSPDGRYLAFASGVDGPSSDLYVYDMTTATVTRLSSGPEQMLWLDWSPDGQWILHTSAHEINEAGDGTIGNYHAARPDGSEIVSLPSEGVQRWLGWLTDNSYWVADGDNGVGMFNLRQINVPGGEVKTLWPGVYTSVALDREMNQLLVAGTDASGTVGLFRVNLIDLSSELIASGDYQEVELAGLGDLRFFVRTDTGVQAVLADGQMISFLPEGERLQAMALSANGQNLAIIQEESLWWLGSGGEPVQIELPELARGRETILWWPNSQGLFFTLNESLYLLAGPQSVPQLVDTGIPDEFITYTRWIE
ncbi:MAG: PD40 domain-containing protein [Chloroflexi bacterium]|nr:PD40 domain-containing protein [Chloroflexota bacterium]